MDSNKIFQSNKGEIKFSDFAGKKIYLKAWASWCSVCVSALDKINKIANEKNNFEVITVIFPNQYKESTVDNFEKWFKSLDYDFTVIYDQDGYFSDLFQIRKMPTNIYLNQKHQLISKTLGNITESQILEMFGEQIIFADVKSRPSLADYNVEELKEIYLAGGCFWGVEEYIARIYGVIDTVSGYANGNTEKPTYQQVIADSGHAETVKVLYDSAKINLQRLLTYFFRVVDPTSLNKQGNDQGIQYRSGIYYKDEKDLKIIKSVIAELTAKFQKPIVVEVEPLVNFYLAEEEHQNYLVKNPAGYCHIDFNQLKAPISKANKSLEIAAADINPFLYSKPDDGYLRENLTTQQYKIIQNAGTEEAFSHPYYENHKNGIYVDVATGEPLFLSKDKFESGSGWPSFTKPISKDVVNFHQDNSLARERTEVVSRVGECHLGHVFNDGPIDAGGLRYCINGAAMRFVPIEEMEKEGYGYLILKL